MVFIPIEEVLDSIDSEKSRIRIRVFDDDTFLVTRQARRGRELVKGKFYTYESAHEALLDIYNDDNGHPVDLSYLDWNYEYQKDGTGDVAQLYIRSGTELISTGSRAIMIGYHGQRDFVAKRRDSSDSWDVVGEYDTWAEAFRACYG